MADKKISALTAASTPLAGTEVLPIVQSGATVKATVLDMTSGLTIAPANITGTTTNNNATAGSVGEYVSSTVASASKVSMGNGVTATITTISLTAGDWDVCANVWLDSTSASTTYTVVNAGISTGSASSSVANQYSSTIPNSALVNAYNQNMLTPTVRLSLSGTTNVYLATLALYGTGTLSAYGQLRARRVR